MRMDLIVSGIVIVLAISIYNFAKKEIGARRTYLLIAAIFLGLAMYASSKGDAWSTLVNSAIAGIWLGNYVYIRRIEQKARRCPVCGAEVREVRRDGVYESYVPCGHGVMII